MLYKKDNVIYFYCDTTRKTWIKFHKLLYEINEDDSVEEITLRISSGGGDVCYAFTIASLIENNEKPIHGIVDALCNSSALFILLACKTRVATRCSEFVIHEGSAEEELSTSGLLKRYHSELVLEKETKKYILSKTKINSNEYDNMNSNGVEFYSDDAIKYGIITKCI
jgi:ATP-dependent protease ClpP protease subunit